MTDRSDHDHGDPACWTGELATALVEPDLDTVAGTGGVVWSLPHDGDLDANLVRLAPGARIDAHRNDEVDVLIAVRAGGGELVVDGVRHPLGERSLALVRRGSERAIAAGSDGVSYLSIHRRRGPLTIGRATP